MKFTKKENLTNIKNMNEVREGRLKRLCLYYGYPIGINDSGNTVSEAINIYKDYDIIVFGSGVELPSHPSYANTSAIIQGLKSINPTIEIFGYIPVGQAPSGAGLSIESQKSKVDNCYDFGFTGVFLDEFGFDYKVTRDAQNEIVQYVHSKGMNVIANSWKVSYVFTRENLYLDSKDFYGNPNELRPLVGENDYILFENLFVSTDGSNLTFSEASRLEEVVDYFQDIDSIYGQSFYDEFKTKSLGLDSIHASYSNKEDILANTVLGSLILNINAYGVSPEYWGASENDFHHYKSPYEDSLYRRTKHDIVVEDYDGETDTLFSGKLNGNNLSLYWSSTTKKVLHNGALRNRSSLFDDFFYKVPQDTTNTSLIEIASTPTISIEDYKNYDIFSITGTNNITGITPTFAGHEVTFIFADILDVTDGGNLKLSGNVTTSADDTLTLICDGTNWIEKCRSVN